MASDQVCLDELFVSKAHPLKAKEDIVDDLVYIIAKRIDSEQESTKTFTYRVDQSSKRKRYIQLKTFRTLKRLYGIKGHRAPKDKDMIHLKGSIGFTSSHR